MIQEILEREGIKEYAFYPFSEVKDRFIACSGIRKIPKGAQTILMLLFPYRTKTEEHNLSVYAISRDYHHIVGEILEKIKRGLQRDYPRHTFVSFCDHSPIREKETAARAGLGIIGDHDLLINRRYGSYCFIGEIITDLRWETQTSEIRGCLHCGACKRICPGGALDGEKIDCTRCVSAITQKKGELTVWEEDLIRKAGFVWGCDLCQEVCPLNMGTEETEIKAFLEDRTPIIRSGDYRRFTERAFHYRKEEVIERNIRIIEDRKG